MMVILRVFAGINMKKKDTISKFDRPAYVPPKRFVRPGSMTVLAAPSRIHNTLFYPNGEVKHEKKPD
jgi:hypothetical protein